MKLQFHNCIASTKMKCFYTVVDIVIRVRNSLVKLKATVSVITMKQG